MTREAMR